MDNAELFSGFTPDPPMAQAQAVSGANGDPDTAAKALDISKKTGAPASVVEPNLDQFFDRWKQNQASQAVQNNPAAAGYVASHPMAAKVSGDDWGNLNRASKTLDSYHDGGSMFSAMLSGPLQAIQRLAGAYEGAKEAYGAPLSESISQEDRAKYPTASKILTPLIYGIEGSKKLFAAGIGGASGYAFYWAKDAGMNDANAGRFARDIGIFATGAMVESGFQPHGEVMPKGEPKPVQLTPEAEASIAAGEMPRPGADSVIDDLHKIQQKVDSTKVDKMVEDSDQSLTKQRSPEMYSEFARQHGTGTESISIPADKVLEEYKSKGLTPGGGEGPFEYVPDLAAQVKQGLESGTEVKIPLADYVANTDAAQHAAVKDSIRFRPEGVTGEEAKELGKGEAKEPESPSVTVPDGLSDTAKQIAQSSAQVKDSLYLKPLLTEGKTLGITESEFKRYSDRIENHQNEIISRAVAAAEREVKKPLTEKWKKDEEATRFQVEKEARVRPDVAADRFLRTGELPNGTRVKLEAKLNGEAVEAALGKDHSLGDLTQKKGGVLPDDIANLLGFDSGKGMLKALQEYNYGRTKQGLSPAAYLKAGVEKETQARMREQHGLLPENILAEARDIATDDLAGDMLSDEIKFMARAGGMEIPLSKEQLRAKAVDDFGRLTLDKVPAERELLRAIEKGGRDAEKGLLSGKLEDALKAKLAQRQAFWMYRELKSFQRDQVKLARNIDTVKDDGSAARIDSSHLMQARKVLNSIGVDAGAFPEGMSSFSEFVRQSDGRIAAADWIAMDEGLRTSPDQLTVEETRDLQKTLQSVLHVGRDLKQIDTAFAQASLEDVVRDTIGELSRFDLVSQPLSSPTIKERLGSFARTVSAANILPERILDYTDKYNPNGPMSRWVDRPLREAFAKKLQYQERIVKDIKALREFTDNSVTDVIDNQLIRDPKNEGFARMTHWNLRKIMLYMGSESGREKVIRGFFQERGATKLDPMEMDYLGKQVEKLIRDNASANDVKFTNAIFAIHEKLLPDIKALQLADTGVPMDTVKPRSYSTPHGDVTGGYTRVRYDRTRSSIEQDLRGDQSWFESGYRQITTPHGFTERRTGYSGFVDMDMTLFKSELDSVVHDLAFRMPVRNAGKLVNDPTWTMAMRQKWGDQYADLFPQWLRDIANAGTVDDQYAKGFVKFLSEFRQNVVSALVGMNVSTMEKHGLSAAGMSVNEAGFGVFKELATAGFKDAKDLAAEAVSQNPELADYYKSLTTEKGMSQWKFALQSSAILRNRVRKYNESISGAYDEATATGLWSQAKNIRELSMYFGRMPISVVDGMSTIPEWITVYKREMGVSGDHTTAVYAADKAVSRSHGSAFIGDAPAILRQKNTLGGELLRWVTPLYKFWNHNLNMLAGLKWDIGGKIQDRDEATNTWAGIANAAFWTSVVPIIAEEISGPPLDSSKHSKGSSMLMAIGRYFGGQLPFVRDVSNAVLNGYEPSVGLIGSVGHQLSLAAREITRHGDNAISRLMTGLAIVTGVGSQPVGKAVQYGTHVLQGRERPQSGLPGVVQMDQGIRTGSQKPRRY